MDLPWNLCPFCSTPTPGMRRENLSLDDALKSLTPAPLDDFEDELEFGGFDEEEAFFEDPTNPEDELETEEDLQDEGI